MRRVFAGLLLLAIAGCGGTEKKRMETDSIRDRANQADRDLDRESSRNQRD